MVTSEATYERLNELAEQGDGDAQFRLGVAYENGSGVPQDSAKAFAWYRRAAAQGYAYAQYALGVAYELGQGVQLDMEVAKKWYRIACVGGCQEAYDRCGALDGQVEQAPNP